MSTKPNNTSNDCLTLFNKSYVIDRIISNGNSGPHVSIEIKDIDLTTNHVVMCSDKVSIDFLKQAPIFYKHEGKYIVIIGLEKCYEASNNLKLTHIRGRLLTKHNLKRALKDENEEATSRLIEEQIKAEAVTPRARFEERPRSQSRHAPIEKENKPRVNPFAEVLSHLKQPQSQK